MNAQAVYEETEEEESEELDIFEDEWNRQEEEGSDTSIIAQFDEAGFGHSGQL